MTRCAMAAESTIQSGIIAQINKIPGCWQTKVHQSGYGRKGIPDVLCCMWGVFVALEVKQPGGKLRKDQITELWKIREAGGVAGVVDCIEDVWHIVAMVKAGWEPRKVNETLPLPQREGAVKV